MEETPNLFKLYHSFTKRSEPPANFHAWSVIAMISAALGKKCFIPQGHFTVFPNLYIVLVGDAGSRKTTAMDTAGNLLSLINIPRAPDSATRESLIDDMAANKVSAKVGGKEVVYSQATAFVSELHEFLGGKHINHQMVMFLTAIWDRIEYKERTRKGGVVSITNPYFTLLGCCTPNWMNSNLKQNVISDGFARRTIFVLENEIENAVAWPELHEEEAKLLPILKHQIERIHKLGGKFYLTDEAREMYIKVYPTFRLKGEKFSDKVKTYFSSKHVLLLKICMCMSAAMRNDRIVDTSILRLAMSFLDESEKSLEQVFGDVGRNELKAFLTRVFNYITAKGTCFMQDILNSGIYDDINKMELEEVVKVLEEQGRISWKSESFSGPPICRPVQSAKPDKARNLLELAGRTVPSASEKTSDLQVSGEEYRLDPVTEQLLAQKTLREVVRNNGVLYRGKMSVLLQKPDSPADSAVPQ